MSGKSASVVPRPEPTTRLDPVRSHRRLRTGLLAAAMLIMASGLYGGLLRIGWLLPLGSNLADMHGPLMVSGVFGTLISLERAVALGRRWTYLAPGGSAIGALLLLAGAPLQAGAAAFVIAGAVLSFMSLRIAILQPALFTMALLFGALGWLAGNALWLAGYALPQLAGWWLAFFICTIAAERLELSRMVGYPKSAKFWFVAAIAALLAGAALGLVGGAGDLLFGAGLLATTLWLLRYDIARVTVRQKGRTRFFAIAMVSGYGWLGVAAVGLLVPLPNLTVFAYDLVLHVVLIGFVLSMVFGHALIILPAVAGLQLRYSPALYVPLALLHGSVVLRIVGGMRELAEFRAAGGMLTLIAILGFAVTLAVVSRSARKASEPAKRAAVL